MNDQDKDNGKALDLQVLFRLSEEMYEEFDRQLGAPVRDLPRMRRLLTEPGFFDDRPS
jgi:hypothetical protein